MDLDSGFGLALVVSGIVTVVTVIFAVVAVLVDRIGARFESDADNYR